MSWAGAVKPTTATSSRFFGEVRFVQALAYCKAVRVRADEPLVTTEITSVSDAYAYGRPPRPCTPS